MSQNKKYTLILKITSIVFVKQSWSDKLWQTFRIYFWFYFYGNLMHAWLHNTQLKVTSSIVIAPIQHAKGIKGFEPVTWVLSYQTLFQYETHNIKQTITDKKKAHDIEDMIGRPNRPEMTMP